METRRRKPRPTEKALVLLGIFWGMLLGGFEACGAACGEEFRVLAWNVESNRPGSRQDSDARVIASQLVNLLKATATRSQIVALSEVAPADVHAYHKAVSLGLGVVMLLAASTALEWTRLYRWEAALPGPAGGVLGHTLGALSTVLFRV